MTQKTSEHRKLTLRDLAILGVAAVVVMGLFLWMSSKEAGLGFPLDDSWIHQTYARNLAVYGEWSFTPGEPSGGSTSPLWSLLLSLGYLLKIDHKVFAYIVGAMILWGTGVAGEALARRLPGSKKMAIPWVGLVLVGEWHLVWAAASGMETLLYGLLVLVLFYMLFNDRRSMVLAGLLSGLLVWVRPDGVTILGPYIMMVLWDGQSWKQKSKDLAVYLLFFTIIVSGYALFNISLAGTWLPNTFFAKQIEYAVHKELPFINRLGSFLVLPLVGSGALLVIGFLYITIESVMKKWWRVIWVICWFSGYLLLFVFRLPVPHQHGRYLIPAMPVFFVLAAAGTLQASEKLNLKGGLLRALSQAWYASALVILLIFLVMGASAYATDVAIIETEMVVAARWIDENTPPDALIAAHDIGAVGYYAQRELVDLAGLISPEVIPIILDEGALVDYLDERGADYLVTFPDWYNTLTDGKEALFETGSPYTLTLERMNMVIYRWN